jgi:D-alanyl-D-alanine carboxypeptidase
MTATVCLDLLELFNVHLDTLITVVPSAANLVGTSAELIIGDQLTIEELMHGMMLPSGNDAA